MSDAKNKHLPTHEEIEKWVTEVFPTPNSMCPGLCAELQNTLNALEDPGILPKERAQLLIRLHAIEAQVNRLHCRCRLQ